MTASDHPAVRNAAEAASLGFHLAVQELNTEQPRYAAIASRLTGSGTTTGRCVALGHSEAEAAEAGLRALRTAHETGEPLPDLQA